MYAKRGLLARVHEEKLRRNRRRCSLCSLVCGRGHVSGVEAGVEAGEEA